MNKNNLLPKSMLLITIVFTVVVGGVCAQDIKSNLPPCKGEDVKKWSNCFGMVNFPNVEKYVGEFRDGKYHGKGTYYFLADNKYKGDKYSGEFIENIFNGQGEYTSFDGRKYIGEFKYGLVNGRGIYTFPNGDKYIGEFKDDRRSGQGIYTFANGQKQEGIWENGNFIREAKVTLPNLNQAGKLDSSSLERERQLLAELAGRNQEMVSNLPPCKEDDPRKWNNCFAPLYYPNGDKYVGEWKDGNTSGFGAYFSLAESPFKGDRYVGEWKNGLRNGKGTYYHLAENKNKGDKYIGDWKNDERNGQGAFYHLAENQNKGDKYVGEWKSGEKNGLGIYTYANGIKLEGVWDNGSFIREAKVNLPIINANQTDIAVLDRERQQLQSELRKLEEEKRNREQARNNQRINLQVSNTQPDSTGAFTITIKTNSDTASLQIDGVEEGGKQDGNYVIKRIARAGQTSSFKIVATDVFGNTDTKSIVVTRQIAQSSQVKYAELNPAQVKQQTNKDAVAIIIGIGDYKKLPKADYANDDARTFYDYAIRGLGIKAENIKLLIDADAEQTEILKAFKTWLPARVKPTTDVYVYYSGHGLPSSDGQTLYLLPQQADRDLIEDTAVAQSRINAAIQATKPKSVTIFLDSCYSGAARTGETLLASARPVVLKANAQTFPLEFTVISASTAEQISSSSPELKHGIFSYYLMKGMEGEADSNKDGKITAGEMHSYLTENVARQASLVNRVQQPQLTGDANRVLVGR